MKRVVFLTMILVVFVTSNLFSQGKRDVEYEAFLEKKFSPSSQQVKVVILDICWIY